ncbi:hypothetical protein FA13DRAFT_1739846 [Coprinellus micaceus]|uniref:Uncharacterized protein n=1 Tax=Coprinellus micaceus TaxID=71717 RepID=A0A4Y7SP43_COPMI|nr:hypothetical protein FA13DRAFT_1739846 [Coprinellus micaceus]
MSDALPSLQNGEFLSPADRQEQMYNMIAFWLGGAIYGIYLVLFIAALFITNRKRGERNTVSRTFYVSMYIMFIVATAYSVINIYRFVQAYANREALVQPIYYFRNSPAWPNYCYIILVTSLVLFADALVIYRCFIIWECSYYIVAVPTLLLAASIGINAVVVMWFAKPTLMTFKQIMPFVNMIYPINLAQNILTTGLIAYKIWKQHVISRDSGLYSAANWNMLTVMRIMIESASIYTIQQIVLCVLSFLHHPAQVIIHATLIPSIGIVFALIAVRTHMVVSSADDWPFRSSFMIPGWSYDPEEDGARRRPSSDTPPITPSSANTKFGDLPFLRKDDDLDRDISFMEMLKEDSKHEEDRSTSRSSV